MNAEIIKVYKQNVPALRFIGKIIISDATNFENINYNELYNIAKEFINNK